MMFALGEPISSRRAILFAVRCTVVPVSLKMYVWYLSLSDDPVIASSVFVNLDLFKRRQRMLK